MSEDNQKTPVVIPQFSVAGQPLSATAVVQPSTSAMYIDPPKSCIPPIRSPFDYPIKHPWDDILEKIEEKRKSPFESILGNGIPLKTAITTEEAFNHIVAEMKRDSSYAWTWQCNFAMILTDGGIPSRQANVLADRLMQQIFNVEPRFPPTTQAENESTNLSRATAESVPSGREAS